MNISQKIKELIKSCLPISLDSEFDPEGDINEEFKKGYNNYKNELMKNLKDKDLI